MLLFCWYGVLPVEIKKKRTTHHSQEMRLTLCIHLGGHINIPMQHTTIQSLFIPPYATVLSVLATPAIQYHNTTPRTTTELLPYLYRHPNTINPCSLHSYPAIQQYPTVDKYPVNTHSSHLKQDCFLPLSPYPSTRKKIRNGVWNYQGSCSW